MIEHTSTLQRLGLRARLMVLLALAALPTLGAILYSGVAQRINAIRDAEQDVLLLARNTAAQHQRLTTQTRSLLSLLARQPEVRSLDAALCSPFLARFLTSDDPYINLGAIDPQGAVRCSVLPLENPVNVADLPVFRAAIEQKRFAAGSYVADALPGEPVVVSTYPLLETDGTVQGAVFAAISLTWISRLIAAADLPSEAMATLVDRDLRVLARFPRPDEWIGKTVTGTAIGDVFRATRGEQVLEAEGLDGTRRLLALTTLPGEGGQPQARVSIGIAVDAALAPANAVLRRNLAAFAIVTVLLFVIFWWGSEVLVMRQVRELVAATRQLGRGNLSARVSPRPGTDELAQLSRAYNQMADALQRREREAREHTEEIARLNRIYAVLSASNAAVLRIHARGPLLQEICRVAVEHGAFRLALIAEPSEHGKEVRAVACAGTGADQDSIADLCRLLSSDTLPGPLLPTVTVLRENRIAVMEISETAPQIQALLNTHGVLSCAGFPLRIRGEVVASLSLFAREPRFFDQQELKLLQSMAADASFGLEYLEKEKHRLYLAYYDTLTNLPNRFLFHERLEQQLQWARTENDQLAVIVLGLRGFRRINDTLGRRVGDAVLDQTARTLRNAIDNPEHLARIGNDEFAVMLPSLRERTELVERANQILSSAPKTVCVYDRDVYVDWGGGVAIYPSDAMDAHTLLKHAELAAHVAAHSGETLMFYTPAMETHVRRRFDIESSLRGASRRGELALHYQPVVDIHSGRATSVEALMRWKSEELGPLTAGSFIPVAEESGLIVLLGEWALAEACQQLQSWQKQGLPHISIAVNVSVKQLQQPGFAKRVLEIIRASGCNPSYTSFAVEVTESELMRNVHSCARALAELKEAGVMIYVDDFGTGYSSLSYLQQLPIDVLKIDQSFVQDMVANPRTLAMVRAITAMAHTLGLRVVAEGVENRAALDALVEVGCDAVQGHLLSVPRAANELEPLLREQLLAT